MVNESVEMLSLWLHGRRLGWLAGYRGGRNVLVFDDDWRLDESRATLSLSLMPTAPHSQRLLQSPWMRRQRLHPWLSNLLPEGALREWLAAELKVHPDNEFPLLAALGHDLPGALEVAAVAPDEMPAWVLAHRRSISPEPRQVAVGRGFSLAGVQMKFSMREQDGRFLGAGQALPGDWIIKPPSPVHPWLVENEYSAMRLAEAVGVTIPEIRLIPLEELEGLPRLNLPDEPMAYAIKRFDRAGSERVHAEDFAQVLFRYPHEKYAGPSYEQIGRLVREFSADGMACAAQMARRLLVNLLLVNGDAHLKNWSLVYPDRHRPRLSPAYDIVTTRAYLPGEREAALNLNGKKDWEQLRLTDFQHWADRVGVSWPAVESELQDTLRRARDTWPDMLESLPMAASHKALLRKHWRSLATEWRIG
ncbi:HipA domain-containing protein [Halomonas sp. SSL-5]|uniref:type II toxin-antitoxin system HipA family toxin n=1 Tax=Halomonas sp. SSL-5 TaxID=3065855 RepID=UPI00273A33E8|nr:HipA domain-containing protein [Halomonas sp. SSL-5]MDY7116766.1 HipA domain-containing protein [Halomonas sp. SSL-5]